MPVIDSVDDPQRFADMVNPEDNLIPKLGILGIGIDKSLAAMLPDLRNSYGVVVAAGSSPADLTSGTGLQPGDVIYSVNQAPVATVEALRKKVDEFKAGRRGGHADRTLRTADVCCRGFAVNGSSCAGVDAVGGLRLGLRATA